MLDAALRRVMADDARAAGARALQGQSTLLARSSGTVSPDLKCVPAGGGHTFSLDNRIQAPSPCVPQQTSSTTARPQSCYLGPLLSHRPAAC